MIGVSDSDNIKVLSNFMLLRCEFLSTLMKQIRILLGFQRSDGAFGAFIVRIPEDTDPHCSLYDYDLAEHTMIVLDWNQQAGLAKFVAHHHSDGNNKPTTLLVNGLGRFKNFDVTKNATSYVPTSRFIVERVSVDI